MTSNTNISDDAFARLVAEEVKNKVSRSQRRILLEEQNWDKWRRALEALVQLLDTQLSNLKEWEDADRDRYSQLGSDGVVLLNQAVAEYQSRRTKIERFRFHVERRLDEVTEMIETGSPISEDIDSHAKLFENAIKKHKELLEKYDIEPNPIDLSLWDALDGRWTFNEIKAADVISD